MRTGAAPFLDKKNGGTPIRDSSDANAAPAAGAMTVYDTGFHLAVNDDGRSGGLLKKSVFSNNLRADFTAERGCGA